MDLEFTKLTFEINVWTVSYTHLDVYKRQIEYGATVKHNPEAISYKTC